MPQPVTFDDAWTLAETVPGWLTRNQGEELWHAAGAVPEGGHIVEIGSHQGRSTTVIATAAKARNATVSAIDPFIDGVLFGGVATKAKFERNVASAGLDDVVTLIAEHSGEARPSWTTELDMLYIDGKHDYWTVRDDLRWTAFLRPGTAVLIHDSFSSIGVTLALYVHVLPRRRLRYVHRVGSLALFVVARPSTADRLRLLAEVPWWLRNVLIKIALRVPRLFGYRRPDPF